MKRVYLVPVILSFVTTAASAAPLVYTPVNPNFGGSPLNGNFLLSEATADDHFKDHSGETPSISPAQAIANDITQGILSKAESQVLTDINNGVTTNTYHAGNTTISYTTTGNIIHLTVDDGQTITEVDIPASI